MASKAGLGRRRLPAEDALTEHLDIRVSPKQLADLRDACETLGVDLSQATRDALNEYVGDFRERRIFDRRRRSEPIPLDQRRGDRRRVHLVTFPESLSALST